MDLTRSPSDIWQDQPCVVVFFLQSGSLKLTDARPQGLRSPTEQHSGSDARLQLARRRARSTNKRLAWMEFSKSYRLSDLDSDILKSARFEHLGTFSPAHFFTLDHGRSVSFPQAAASDAATDSEC